jgi:anti-anti-sigma regulatory factor
VKIIRVTVVADETIVELGDSRTPSESERLEETVKNLLEQGHRKIVLDLQQVSVVDGAEADEIARGYTTANRGGATLRLRGLSQRHLNLLVITKLSDVLIPKVPLPPDPIDPHRADYRWITIIGALLTLLAIAGLMIWR